MTDCEHVNWAIYPGTLFGQAQCNHCGVEMSIAYFINGDHHRLRELEERLKTALDRAEKFVPHFPA